MYSDAELDSLGDVAPTDMKLLQWSAKLRAGLLASVPEAGCSQAQAALPPPKASQLIVTAPGGPSKRACGPSLLSAAATLGGAMPRSVPFGLGLFSDAMPRWLALGNDAWSQHAVRGTVTVRGSLQQGYMDRLRTAIQQALFEVLLPAAGPDLCICVSACKRAEPPSLGLPESPQACVEFAFELLLSDPNDSAPALEVLRLEAESGGARRLLPLLANSALGAVGHLAVRLEIASDCGAVEDQKAPPDESSA